MLIRLNHLEKGMHVTYQDIQQQYLLTKKRHGERRAKLHQDAYSLVAEYKDSLALKSDTWRNSQADDNPYVTTGILSKGEYQRKPISSFDIDESLSLKFVIATVIDDSIMGGSYYLIDISMRYENGLLIVDIGAGKEEIIVADPGKDGGYYAVCSCIKQLVLSGLIDHRLE
ncbi:hypothetical protein [Pectobacterium odoriferum]|uniref:hypothetical protein n=1 Tax=Pectobacterium odoriferum TaxID=78398 RepID=UPI00052A5705|nr:hypothetical protein [Pectobacterium odoriferum]AIU88321.1 hypothetical protein BCS7_09345 [Pectobacterium odoriferum]POE20466.1 hypothetical protein BV918_01995 [Pectobacterium odoriferum]POE37186.1 hypothetical protein BV922_01990 [Pectobacterium odoriferum]